MNKLIRKETNPDRLRDMLAKCESEIKNLAYDYCDGERLYCPNNIGKIRKKTELRADILDRLFELHFNKTDFERLSLINNMLKIYEQNMIAKHVEMYNKLKEIDNDYTLYSHMVYRHSENKPQLQALEDDSYYGFDWNEMIDIIDFCCRIDKDIFECSDEGCTVYDDGWQETIKAAFSVAQDIKPCYSFWNLLNEHGYSIPDVLQMTTYKYVHEAWANLICNV